MEKSIKLRLVASVTHEDASQAQVTVVGRDGWALLSLLAAGATGCTPITRPAPRWSHYIFKLRRHGIKVETIDERHDGAFAGTHARYVLRDKVSVSGGTLDAYLQSAEGRREFAGASFRSVA